MEAVPRLPMISFPGRTTGDTDELSSQIKKYIRHHYHEDPESYNNETFELEGLRRSAINATTDFVGCSTLKKYYCQLSYLTSRFPFHEYGMKISFTWYSAFDHNSSNNGDMSLEMDSILYNIATLHTALGALDARTSSDGMKISCTHFQCAAGAFQALAQHSKGESELNPLLMNFMMNLSLSQAQECILEKSMTDHRKPNIIAKVAMQVVDYLKQTLKNLDSFKKSNSLAVDLVGSKLMKMWQRHCEFKIAYYYAVTFFHQGLHSEEQQKMGERLSYLQGAVEKLEEASKAAKNLEKAKTLGETLTFANDVIRGKQTACQKENEFVYHEKVPALASLPEVKGASLVKGISFSVNDVEVAGPDIFGRLVPMEAHQASSMYSEEKAKLLRNIGQRVQEKNEELDTYLASMQLDSLAVDDNLDVLPQELVECCADLNARDALKELTQIMSSISQSYHDIKHKIHNLQGIIQGEEEKEKEFLIMMGNRKRSSSNPVLSDFKREVSKYFEAHETAMSNNQALHTAITQHRDNISLLSQPLNQLLEKLPSTAGVESDGDRLTRLEVQRLLNKVGEMQSQRRDLDLQLRNDIHQDDITKQLVTNQEDIQIFFEEQLKKFSPLIALLEQNMKAQVNILQALSEANATYGSARRQINKVKSDRMEMIDAFICSYNTFVSITVKASDAKEFYSKLEAQVNKLESKIQTMCKSQEGERESKLSANVKKFVSKDTTHFPSTASTGPKLKDFLLSGGGAKTLPDQGVEIVYPPSAPSPGARYSPSAAGYTSFHPQENYGSNYPQSLSQQQDHNYSSASDRQGYSTSSWSPRQSMSSSEVNEQKPESSGSPHQQSQGSVSYPSAAYPQDLSNQTTAYSQQQPSTNQNASTAYPSSIYGPRSSARTTLPSSINQNTYDSSSSTANQVPPSNYHSAYGYNSQMPGMTSASQIPTTTYSAASLATGQTHTGIVKSGSATSMSYRSSAYNAYSQIPATSGASFYSNSQAASQNLTSVCQSQNGNSYSPSAQYPYSHPSQYGTQQPYSGTQPQASYPTAQSQAAYPGVRSQASYPAAQSQAVYPGSYAQASYPVTQSQASYPGVQSQTSYPVTQVPTTYQGGSQPQTSYPVTQSQMSYPGGGQPQTSYPVTQSQTSYAGPQSQTSYPVTQSQVSYPVTQSQVSYPVTQPQTSYPVTQPQTSYPVTQSQMTYPMTQSQTAYTGVQSHTSYTGGTQAQSPYPVTQSQSSYSNYGPPTYAGYAQDGTPYAPANASYPQSNIPNSQTSSSYSSNVGYNVNNYEGIKRTEYQPGQNPSTYIQTDPINSSHSPRVPQNASNYPSNQLSNSKLTAETKVAAAVKKTSNVDLLSDLDLNPVGSSQWSPLQPNSSQSCLSSVPSSVASEIKSEPAASNPEHSPDIQMNSSILDITKLAKQTHRSISLVNPLSNDETLNLLVAETEKFSRFVQGLDKKPLNGPTNLEIKWKELLDATENECAHLKVSVGRCYPLGNRFPDILPYDANRVQLPSARDDYINASYVQLKSVEDSIPLILTQAPLPNTMQDFWTMVWENNTEIVASLNADAEVKGQIYYPKEGSLDVGVFTLTLKQSTCSPCQCWLQQTILLQHNSLKASKVVLHVQFLTWPPGAMPESPGPFLQFLMQVNSLHKQQRNKLHPVVVHCISGTGRSGVFAVMSSFVKHLQSTGNLTDIWKLLLNLNQQRRTGIQDKAHLLFLYSAALYNAQEALMKRGILTGKTTFEEGPREKTHVRHPSADLLSSDLNRMKAKLGFDNDSPKSEGNLSRSGSQSSVLSGGSLPSTTINGGGLGTAAAGILSGSPAKKVPINPLPPNLAASLDPEQLDLSGAKPSRITKESFLGPHGGLGTAAKQDGDPFADIDPLWKQK